MRCPKCFSKDIKVLERNEEKIKIYCDYCLFEGCITDELIIEQKKRADEIKYSILYAKEAEEALASKIDHSIRETVGEIKSSLKTQLNQGISNYEQSVVQLGVKIFENNQNSILEIDVNGKKNSGFLLTRSGYAIAYAKRNIHSCLARIAGEKWISCKTIAFLGDYDIALIKLSCFPDYARVCVLGNSSKVKNGEKIYVIGNSLGAGISIVSGIVSDCNRDGFIMHDAQTNDNGNIGSAVFNDKGEVISIQYSSEKTKRDTEISYAGMRYSIPINKIKSLLSKYNT